MESGLLSVGCRRRAQAHQLWGTCISSSALKGDVTATAGPGPSCLWACLWTPFRPTELFACPSTQSTVFPSLQFYTRSATIYYSEELEKEEQTPPTVSRRKHMTKTQAELHEIENKKPIPKNATRNCPLKRFIKLTSLWLEH